MAVPPPVDDADVPRFWRELGLPGLVDTHVHFLPPRVQAKVWKYFEDGAAHYGTDWPVAYALPDEEERLAVLERLGVRAFPTLPYPHKPGMAAWLNDWSAEFAQRDPRVLHSATFYPEPEAPVYVAEALDRGARVFKVHVQVGAYDPRHELLDPAVHHVARARAQHHHHRRRRRHPRAGDARVGIDDRDGDRRAGAQAEQFPGRRRETTRAHAGCEQRAGHLCSRQLCRNVLRHSQAARPALHRNRRRKARAGRRRQYGRASYEVLWRDRHDCFEGL